jgi:hypothetical protein
MWFTGLEFDCVGNLESCQVFNERGEDTVARDIFRVEQNLNKARRQAITIIDEKSFSAK